MLFWAWLVISDLYLVYLIVLLNYNLTCSKSLLLFLVDKVTAGTYNYASVIWNAAPVGEASLCLAAINLVSMLAITHPSD